VDNDIAQVADIEVPIWRCVDTDDRRPVFHDTFEIDEAAPRPAFTNVANLT
jgi:hypothetical protein